MDLYASRRIGAETVARVLVKVHVAGYLSGKARYAALVDCSINVPLDSVSSLTAREIAKGLLLQTLLARGFIDALTKPLEKTHPPLYLRLRALRTAFEKGL